MAMGSDAHHTHPWAAAGVPASTDSNNGVPRTVLIAMPATGASDDPACNGAFAPAVGFCS